MMLCWAHISEGMFSYVAALLSFPSQGRSQEVPDDLIEAVYLASYCSDNLLKAIF